MPLAELLQDVIAVKGVTSASVVASDGSMLESASHDERDLGFVGGLITSGLASSRVLASFLGDGELQQAMIEYDQGPVLLIPLGQGEADPVLVVTLQSTSVLGRVRLQFRKLVPDVAQAASA